MWSSSVYTQLSQPDFEKDQKQRKDLYDWRIGFNSLEDWPIGSILT